MSSIIVAGDTSGSITLQAPAVAGSTVLTLPAVSGTVLTSTSTQSSFPPNIAGNGPAFSAYPSASQTLTSSTFTKVQINTEEFDTNSNYDNTTNYRFTPTVAGYYQVNGTVNVAASTGNTRSIATFYKNGSEFKRGVDTPNNTGTGAVTVSCIVSMNGTTDYIELYGYIVATVPVIASGAISTHFSAAMVRSA